MSQVKIVVEEKLGGQVSFGGKEVRILKATYEAVPEDKRAEFDEVLVKAQESYKTKVDEAKKAGMKPQASKLKAEAINEVITPFLEANSVSKGVVKRTEGRVVKPTVVREDKKNLIAKSATDKESLKKEFDNFPVDMLDDSGDDVKVQATPKGNFDDLEDELGIDDILGDGDEEVHVSSHTPKHKDPFDAPTGDVFDDIDLDI